MFKKYLKGSHIILLINSKQLVFCSVDLTQDASPLSQSLFRNDPHNSLKMPTLIRPLISKERVAVVVFFRTISKLMWFLFIRSKNNKEQLNCVLK